MKTMECPWPNLEEECNTGIVCDLAKLRVSAAMALKKIESTYRDIMGCSREYNDSELSPDFINCDSELNNNYTPQTSTRDMGHVMCEPEQVHVHTNHICRICHKAFSVPSDQFREAMYFGYHDPSLKPHNCASFTEIMNPYFLNKVDNFVDEEHQSMGNSSKVSSRSSNSNESKHRMHKCPLKVTVPEPFQMTLRDEDQKIIKELKIEQLKNKLNEEKAKEMQVKFHSTPVPGHVHMPIYQKMLKQNEERKMKRKQTAETIKNSAKVCNLTFTKKNCLHKASSVPDLSVEEKQQTAFKAQAAPKHILSSHISERLRNREVVRKFRIKQRAQETLQQASLPFSSRKSFNRSSSLINLRKEEELKNQRTVPKYRKADSTFTSSESKETMRQWNSKVREMSSTDNSTPPLTEKVAKKDYESRYQEFLLSQSLPFYDIPIRMTAASMLREKEIRREFSEKSGGKGKSKTPHKFKETREQLLSQLKMNDLSTTAQEDLERKLQNYRQSRKLRQKEYEKELMEMKKRVEKHPLLIERQSKAKKDITEEDDQSDPHSSSEASLTNHSTSDDS